MPSTFSWVDIDEKSRRKMLDLIATFRDQETVDELGIGTIRDAFADFFFPGTSTIQTRARYFLFVAWMYRRLEIKKTPSNQISGAAWEQEMKLIDELCKLTDSANQGIIGRISRRKLQRLPSNIYWVGMQNWGIRLFNDTQAGYHRSLDGFFARASKRQKNDDGEPLDAESGQNWDVHLPDAPPDFPKNATLDLSVPEADYLREKIRHHHSKSYLSALLEADEVLDSDHPWDNPIAVNVPQALVEDIALGRRFALLIHGAVILYNLLLARKRGHEPWVIGIEKSYTGWVQTMADNKDDIAIWIENLDEFWVSRALKDANIPQRTKDFVAAWANLITKIGAGEIASSAAAEELVTNREVSLKKNRARLANSRYLELWNGAETVALLSYRWFQVKRIVTDIRKCLYTKEQG